jgi:hypothetical protein
MKVQHLVNIIRLIQIDENTNFKVFSLLHYIDMRRRKNEDVCNESNLSISSLLSVFNYCKNAAKNKVFVEI